MPSAFSPMASKPFTNHGAADRDRTGTVFPPRDFKSLASACFATAACHDTKLVYHGVAEYVKVPFFHRGCGSVELQYILDREEKSNKKVEGQSHLGYS